MTDRLTKLQLRVLYGLVGLIFSGGIGWCTWVSVHLHQVPTRGEVKQIVEDEAPYLKEKRAIDEAIARGHADDEALHQAMSRNTAAIRALEQQVASQNATIQGMLKRFEVLPADVLDEVRQLRDEVREDRQEKLSSKPDLSPAGRL